MPQSNYINQPTPPPKILAVVKPARGNELLRKSNANGKPSYPQVEQFTDFYILGPGGEASGYPEELAVGEEAEVIVGIINREQETVSYRLAVKINEVMNNEAGPVTLEHDGRWQEVINFTPDRPGDNQKVEFSLYRLDRDEAYQKLHLWIDVIE